MIGLVFKSKEGQLVTSSKLIATKFNKRHADVLRAIQNLECSNNFVQRNFAFVENQQIGACVEKECFITRDGFSFLVMGFTGKEAAKFKEDFINAFNQMEHHLKTKLPATYLDALKALVASEEAKQLAEKKVTELQPKADVYDNISDASNLIDMNQAAKSLGIGRNKLFKKLRDMKVLMANNNPYQMYISAGYFEVKVKPTIIEGNVVDYTQTYVTGKGLTWLSEKFLI